VAWLRTSRLTSARSFTKLRQVHRQIGQDAPRPRGEHDDPVPDAQALVDVVRDDQDRDAALGPHPQRQVLQILARLGVDRTERLVHQQQDRAEADALHRHVGRGAVCP